MGWEVAETQHKILHVMGSVTKLGVFWKLLANFLTKVAQNIWWHFIEFFKNQILNINNCGYFLGNFWEQFCNFIFQLWSQAIIAVQWSSKGLPSYTTRVVWIPLKSVSLSNCLMWNKKRPGSNLSIKKDRHLRIFVIALVVIK